MLKSILVSGALICGILSAIGGITSVSNSTPGLLTCSNPISILGYSVFTDGVNYKSAKYLCKDTD